MERTEPDLPGRTYEQILAHKSSLSCGLGPFLAQTIEQLPLEGLVP